ncbi:MAG: hypothetical protein GY799_13215 [Desulfobulbaceae bacterium]|nr:hypothetical protein [Desulfobulbaceae bacterium]
MYIVEDSCLQVIGLEEMSFLGMQIDTTSKSVSAVQPFPKSSLKTTLPSADELLSELSTKHPRLFSDDIGLIPNFTHRIQLRPEAIPVKIKARRPPIAMEEAAK